MPAAVVAKQIKPSRLNDKAMRLELLNAMRKFGRNYMLPEFKKTTATWDTPVEFEMLISTTAGSFEVLVGTDNDIYRYVNDGTRPHKIRPKNARVLAFPSMYKAKTAPKVIGSVPGGSSGPTVFANEVDHPGTEPRHFDKEIQKKSMPPYRRAMEAGMKRARQVSGNAI